MSYTGIITQDSQNNYQQIAFNKPTTIDSITYNGSTVTYPLNSLYTLSKAELALFYIYKVQFYNALLNNFPLVSANSSLHLPTSLIEIRAHSAAHTIEYNQTSGNGVNNIVYNITYNTNTKIASFAARAASISITLQEYLSAYLSIVLFLKQATLP